MNDLKIGDVVEVNISGVYTSGIVVDIKDMHTIAKDEYGLVMTFASPTAMFIWSMTQIVRNMDWDGIEFGHCCELLIGDQKVWCESHHWENLYAVQDG